MPELAKKKVGLIACSGEEMPEGTITRLAVRQVLEALRPQQTVTICLPLFLAGGEGDRAFARSRPTIAVDGCEKRCAARGTEMYSGKPAVSIVVSDRMSTESSELGSARRLSETGMQVARDVADQIARHVDELLQLEWDRRSGAAARKYQASGRVETSTSHLLMWLGDSRRDFAGGGAGGHAHRAPARLRPVSR